MLELLSSALSLILPYTCLVCGRPLARSYLCSFCQPEPEGLTGTNQRCPVCHSRDPGDATRGEMCLACRLYPSPFRTMRYIYLYQDQASTLISTIKYRPSIKLCRVVAFLLPSYLERLYDNRDWDLVVPVPPSTPSLRFRGFSPCDVLVESLVAKLRPALTAGMAALQHRGVASPQAALPSKKRWKNVAGAFQANSKYVEGQRILLFDDVVTTGSTSLACAIALQQAGAFSIDLLSLCRARNWEKVRATFYNREIKS